MRLGSVSVTNYKGFLSSGEIGLTPGFNVIVGQNNVGKTALAEAMSLRLAHMPHRSVRTIPSPGIIGNQTSRVSAVFEFDEGELQRYIVTWPHLRQFSLPNPSNFPNTTQGARENLQSLLSSKSKLHADFEGSSCVAAYFDHYGDFQEPTNAFLTTFDDHISPVDSINLLGYQQTGSGGLLSFHLANVLITETYMFRAERMNVGQYRSSVDMTLQSDARNLAQVLGYLQSRNHKLWSELIKYISTILPEIGYITVPHVDESNVQIRIWPSGVPNDRDDLTVSLIDSGTGIGQLLAIMYVVLTSIYPRVIVIDEPQTFLHPGAIRKLIEILRAFPQHQYILTTHSPTVVTSATPGTLLLVRRQDGVSVVKRVDASESANLNLFLNEVGARLSDVFGADSILWVEGRTEELCFPMILEASGRQLLGTTILGVLHTGDFEKRDAKRIIDIYEKLSTGRGLLPPAVGFIFDRERRSEKERDDLTRQSDGRVRFLRAVMYENYLLDPAAIAAVAADLEGFRETPLTVEEVEQWLECHRVTFDLPDQPAQVDGAKTLSQLFSHFSESRYSYDNDKVAYSVALTKWLLEQNRDALSEVRELLFEVLTPVTAEVV